MAPLLEVRGLVKTFVSGEETLRVLRGIDFAAAEGEFTAVVGQSGTGKSTFLHIMGGLDRPSEGEVVFEGRSLFRERAADLDRFRNREVGFVFQFHHLMAEFSALENVMMPALAGRVKPDRARAMALELLDEVGLANRVGHKPGQMSGGEQQRTAVARALVMSPRLLLADEPTGNLDHDSSGKIFGLLKEINARRRLTIVMVTHNRELAAACDRVLTLAGGLISEAPRA
jgi:lipoprotein-releasing system ATP-binding protein